MTDDDTRELKGRGTTYKDESEKVLEDREKDIGFTMRRGFIIGTKRGKRGDIVCE